MDNNSVFEAFELACWKLSKRKVRQQNYAGFNMTQKQKREAMKFLETSYVNACHKVKGELTWDKQGHETYHEPFYVSPVDEETGIYVELTWAKDVEQEISE